MEALAGLFLQVLKLSQKAGLVKLGHVSLDGTKVKANASKHKAMSYGRMKQEEEHLETKVKELLHRAEGVDEQEDRCYGKGQERVGATRSTGCASACPSPCWDWTQITAVGSSTSAFTPTVAG